MFHKNDEYESKNNNESQENINNIQKIEVDNLDTDEKNYGEKYDEQVTKNEKETISHDQLEHINDPNDDKHQLEHYRLAGRKPLITVLILSVGPLLSQITSALYGVVATIWVSKAIGEKGMTAISTYTAFDNIARSFGFFVSVAGSTCISGLFGAGDEKEAGQVICDLLRMCLLFGILVPAVLCPTVKLGVAWFGANQEIVDLGYEYMFPMLVCSLFTCIFVGCGGFLQGEGKSMLYGGITISASIANMLLFTPLFLLAFKTGICGAGIAYALSDAIAGIGLCIFYFMGKFAVKPKFNQLFKKFSPRTLPALKVGLSQLVANLSVSVPGIVVRKFIGMSADSDQDFNDSLAGFNVIFRYAQITNNVILAITMGYLPAASYAFSAKMHKRWIKLSIHANWIGFVWGTITSIFSWSIPREISKIFSKGEGYLRWAGPMLQVGNALGFVVFGRFTFPSMLQSLKMGITSTLLSLASQLVSIIAFEFILYYTDKHNAVRLIWCYPLSYAFGLVLGIIVLGRPIYKIYKEMKDDEDDFKSSVPVLKIKDEQIRHPIHENIDNRIDNQNPSKNKEKDDENEEMQLEEL
ncbi:MatE family protein [Tritrichomonas foetus]|uniref:MatE family protein n=1 Tax=Tritrichomonas foetus TaxID=1144522 RepID=A0A1J4K4T9_9EUKA|nr:MatE family protein [Tritrichomonas foetus]|eukprot:OHT06211.1 MatE family protein [Tritrichomonas foetus]